MKFDKIKYEVGQMIGECVYLGDEEKIKGRRLANFKCKCEIIFKAEITRIKSGHIKSCGCIKKNMLINRNTKHGMKKTVIHSTWSNIINRCCCPNNRCYPRYGGRGITVCDEWRNSFIKFYEDMGDRPSNLHSIDRIDNSKGYYKENCKWATRSEQANNKRTTVYVEYKGERKPLKTFCTELGVKYERIREKMWRKKITFEQSINNE